VFVRDSGGVVRGCGLEKPGWPWTGRGFVEFVRRGRDDILAGDMIALLRDGLMGAARGGSQGKAF
jgi:hypothetical protein